MNIGQKLIQYIKDSKAELKKVVWLSRQQTKNYTLLVIGFSVAMAVFLGAVDYGLTKLIELMIY